MAEKDSGWGMGIRLTLFSLFFLHFSVQCSFSAAGKPEIRPA